MGMKSRGSEVILTQAILSSSLPGPHSRGPAQGNTPAKMDKRQATKTLKWACMNFEQSSVVIGNNRSSSVVIGKNLSYLTYIIDTFNLNRKKEKTP